jgi:hypothetical protein
MGRDTASVVKYKGIDQYIASNSFNMGYELVGKVNA